MVWPGNIPDISQSGNFGRKFVVCTDDFKESRWSSSVQVRVDVSVRFTAKYLPRIVILSQTVC